jgi:hypothetical protein
MREFKALAGSRALDAAAAYAARGRCFRGLSDARLAEKWAAAFRSTVHHPDRADLRALERDLSSEHKLRGRAVPHEQVADYRKLLIEQIVAEFERSREMLENCALGAADSDLGADTPVVH